LRVSVRVVQIWKTGATFESSFDSSFVLSLGHFVCSVATQFSEFARDLSSRFVTLSTLISPNMYLRRAALELLQVLSLSNQLISFLFLGFFRVSCFQPWIFRVLFSNF
jgi:hypothetical protein